MHNRQRQALREPSRLFRGPVVRGLRAVAEGKEAIDKAGGEYGAGIIRGAAVITRGEALGHYMWIDEAMLSQTHSAINATDKGIKSRFTHPSLSGDGLGRALGRYMDAEADGETIRADLHLFESAHKTPDGDLAGYVMDLAVEDPEAFGNSIAFEPDIGAEDRFIAEHEDKEGLFQSPDKGNERNYPHARLAELKAIDAVDTPAANPEGLFHKGDAIAFEADVLLAYAMGLTTDAPDPQAFGIAPERLRGFVARFLDQRGIYLASKSDAWKVAAFDRVQALGTVH